MKIAKGARKQRGPGRPRGSGDNNLEMRSLILAAARRCFGRCGYARTTNKQIADEVGITAGAIYHYFESKESLFATAYDEAAKALGCAIQAGIPEDGSIADRFCAGFRAAVEMAVPQPELMEFLCVADTEVRRSKHMMEMADPTVRWFRRIFLDLVRAGRRKGEVSDATDDETVVDLMIACLLGFAHAKSEKPLELCEAFLHLFRSTLFATCSGGPGGVYSSAGAPASPAESGVP